MKVKVINVAGTRPNFVKITPLIKEMKKHSEIEQVFVHTGQHYDKQLSKLFFRDLKIPKPDINLEVGSGSHALQTGDVMVRFEKVLHKIMHTGPSGSYSGPPVNERTTIYPIKGYSPRITPTPRSPLSIIFVIIGIAVVVVPLLFRYLPTLL